jgi:hypothetical protein
MNFWKEMADHMRQNGYTPDRLLTDLTGQYYTLIMESTYDSMADFEKAFKDETGNDEWRRSYQKFTELVDSGRREIFTIVPIPGGAQTRQQAQATAKVGASR